MYRSLSACLLILVASALPCFAQEPPVKIGIVDRQAIFETPRVVQIIDGLQKKAQAAEEQLRAMEQELQKLRENYESKKLLELSQTADERYREEIREMERRIVEFGRTQLTALREEQGNKEEEITEEIRGIVAAVAEELGYTLILWESAVAYGSVEYDITQLVMERFNTVAGGSR